MKTKNVTFSIPTEIVSQLHAKVAKRELSKFATQAIVQALKEKNDLLKAAYAKANEDPDREEVLKDWTTLDLEGWDD